MSKLDEKKRSNSNSSQSEQCFSKKSKTETDQQTNQMIKYIPMKNGSTNVNRTFKTPFNSPDNQNLANTINKSTKTVQQEIDGIDQEIENLLDQGYKLEELDVIIDKLHIYNDIKDLAQSLLEKIAHIKGCTIKKMHELYVLDPNID
ncbi:DNA repair SWI5 -like protein [Brachionus plicatilis]|uniref:DNA repair protein SWI5 homolog n=1 Tax=Brachionus plicatilis TaxID=10195 RepID=A0A3M7PBP7_BRAPC|nr:DNA repair SWI5 -like protein [Brachionus plicatilis]